MDKFSARYGQMSDSKVTVDKKSGTLEELVANLQEQDKNKKHSKLVLTSEHLDRLAENYPEFVESCSKPFDDVSQQEEFATDEQLFEDFERQLKDDEKFKESFYTRIEKTVSRVNKILGRTP